MKLLTGLAALLVVVSTASGGDGSQSYHVDCGLDGILVTDAGRPIALEGALYGDMTGGMVCQFRIDATVGGVEQCFGRGQINANGLQFGTHDEVLLVPSRAGFYYWYGRHIVTEGGYGWLSSFGTATSTPIPTDGDLEFLQLDLQFSGAVFPDQRPPWPEAAPEVRPDPVPMLDPFIVPRTVRGSGK